jgi:uncharacterized alkaline shock family protein YloU
VTDIAERLPPPEQRGRLEIHDDVVETIARRAAASVSHSVHATGLSRITTTDLPRARVTVRGGYVTAALTIAAQWPTPVTELAHRVRTVVAAQVHDYTGLNVTRVDVEVQCVPPDQPPVRRVQ